MFSSCERMDTGYCIARFRLCAHPTITPDDVATRFFRDNNCTLKQPLLALQTQTRHNRFYSEMIKFKTKTIVVPHNLNLFIVLICTSE